MKKIFTLITMAVMAMTAMVISVKIFFISYSSFMINYLIL